MSRKDIFYLTIICILIATVLTTMGNDENTKAISNVYEKALTEEKAADFFDLSRGMPKYNFLNDGKDEILELTGGYLYSKETLGNEFTLTVLMKSKGNKASSSIEIGRKAGQTASTILSFIEDSNAISILNGSNKLYSLDYPGVITINQWYKLTVTAKDNVMFLYINDRHFTTVKNEDGFDGNFILKGGTGSTLQLKSLSVFETSLKLVSDGTGYGVIEGFFKYMLPGYEQVYTYIPAVKSNEKVQVNIKDAKGVVYESKELNPEDGKYTFSFIPRGASGKQTIEFITGNKTAVCEVYLEAITAVETKDQLFNDFYDNLVYMITSRNQKVQTMLGSTFKMHMSWLRDHIHMLKASVYWEQNQKEALSFWLDNQSEKGFFYEMFFANKSPGGASTIANSDPEFIKAVDPDNSLGRFEIEADIEFMMVEAVYTVWQATGDDVWMKDTLSKLDKAMTWTKTDPERWSKELGLTIRGSSVDCYDFTYGHNTANRRVVWWEPDMDWGTPMAVYHGDNTGFYQSCKMLSEMYKAAGNSERAKYWSSTGNSIQKNLIKTAWNGSYFAHMVQVHPKLKDLPEDWREDLGGDWERLSSGNAYALNRGILTQEQASSIIEAFKNFRDNPPNIETVAGYADEKVFAEWVTIYPSYRKKEYVKYDVGNYINGTIASFTAGELSNGCFKYGYEQYGYDILTRLKALYKRDGSMQFFYKQNGEPYKYPDGSAGGPIGWGAATIQNAVIEGLAGFADRGNQFGKVTLSPAWIVTEHSSAYASASYGASDKYIAYSMAHDNNNNKTTYTIVGDSTEVEFKLLLPSGNIPDALLINGEEVEFVYKKQGESVYAVVNLNRNSNTDVDIIEVSYKEGVPDIKESKEKNHTLILLALELLVGIAAIGTTAFIIVKKTTEVK